mgnify:CR=1 FL=1
MSSPQKGKKQNQFTTLEKIPVKMVKAIKNLNPKIRTWHIEFTFVGCILILIGIFSDKGFVEWIGVLAVFLTFAHTSVSDRLAEQQAKLVKKVGKAEVHCYWKLNYYFYGKEIAWFIYFLMLGAWSALGGAILFLIYRPWRKLWRKYNPL